MKKKAMTSSTLANLIFEKVIQIEASHLHVEFFDENAKKLEFPRDKWFITIKYNDKSLNTFYHSGIGSRVPFGFGGTKVRHERGKWYHPGTSSFLTNEEAIAKNFLALPSEGPPVDQILSSLLSDAQGVNCSFKEWASDFGFNYDSLKALKIYLSCQETRDTLINLFGYELFKQLSKAATEL